MAVKKKNGIDFLSIEKKWQKKWEDSKAFRAKEELSLEKKPRKENTKKKKYYIAEMYPYPSASGLHMGHAFNYMIGDILARFMRMRGFNVLHPMGFDSFGLPAENAAIKEGVHPKKYTEDAIKNFIRQQKSLGFSYDWDRILWSHNPEYYKWNQFLFLQFLKKGLAYRKEAPVNWCPKCESVLANEQVHNGKCWRHTDTEIEIKSLEQWFLRTTNYAQELLDKITLLDWPERIKTMQENWIGRSDGAEILFEINKEKWPIFTTRPDTVFGVTFMVVSAQHPKLMKLVTKEKKGEVEKFLKKIKSTSEKDDIGELEKEGVFTGSYAINPLNGDKVPVYAGNFVVAEYGSGMVMAVPAHDQRDFEFAKKYKIPVKLVVCPVDEKLSSNSLNEAYEGPGNMINSGKFDDLENVEAKEHIINFLEAKKLGRRTVQYKLRDWLVSRQRYWGTPIPIVYCNKCGIVPVPEKELPVKLPEKVKFGEGNPLATNKDFVNTNCPKCKGSARRETDTMDTFFDSSWYYLRYLDSKNKKMPFEKKKAEYWMPVDFYTGGAEHACMHLIYARFFVKALRDIGFIKLDEPFKRLFNQGMIHGEDGFVMSKSRGNVVDPLDAASKYGADSLRLFLVSVASPDKDYMWNTNGLEASWKLVNKIYSSISSMKVKKSSKKQEHKINKAVKEVTLDIENLQYNAAVIKLRALFDSLESEASKNDLESLIKVVSPFCPHISEELWAERKFKGFASLAEWPLADEKKIDEKLEEAEKNVEKTIADILNILNIIKEKEGKEGAKIYLYVIPNELSSYDYKSLSKRIGKEVKVFAVNDKKKHDPQNKSGKAKPGKPGIYVE